VRREKMRFGNKIILAIKHLGCVYKKTICSKRLPRLRKCSKMKVHGI